MARRFLTAEWRNLVMLNYEIDPEILRPLVPPGTVLDAWNGKHFVSLVGFQFLNTRVLGMPIPFHRNFDEVNLRFYVRREAPDGPRRAVTFIKEAVPRLAIALMARWLYNENYVACPMQSEVHVPISDGIGSAVYRWGRGSSMNILRAGMSGAPAELAADSEEAFITEHYWGYVRQRDGSTVEYRVEHPRWRVWQAADASFVGDVAGFYGPEFGAALGRPPSSAFVAEGSEVAVYVGERMLPSEPEA